jgi:mannose-6-phosphate isomerase-like protein (cupin superfamily)
MGADHQNDPPIYYHNESPWQDWRPGVRTRLWSGAIFGAAQAHMGEQIIQPGSGTPRHTHYYEEHLTVFRGRAEITVGDETATVDGPATVVVPPMTNHSFKNVGDGELHIIGASPWPMLQAEIPDDPDGAVWIGWEPGNEFQRRRLQEEGRAG